MKLKFLGEELISLSLSVDEITLLKSDCCWERARGLKTVEKTLKQKGKETVESMVEQAAKENNDVENSAIEI
jgi:hypothetical protein